MDSPQHKSHPTRTLFYPSLDKCLSLETDLQVIRIDFVLIKIKLNYINDLTKILFQWFKDFVSSLFWVLESKRLGALNSIEKDKQPFLCAPFERKDLIGTTKYR